MNRKTPSKCFASVFVLVLMLMPVALVTAAFLGRAPALAQDAGKTAVPDLAKVKQEEAREKLERLEEAMDRLSRALMQNEPQNAAKLKLAFREARDHLLREGMDRVVKYLSDRKLDRAIEEQGQLKVNLEELLSILLEKDIDPRELLKHIRRVRDVVQTIDKVIQDETSEKMSSDDAEQAGASSDALKNDLAALEELIRRQKEVEKSSKEPETATKDGLGKLAPEEDAIRGEAQKLREGDAKRAEEAKASPPGEPKSEQPNQPGQPSQPGQPVPGGEPAQPGQPQPPPDGAQGTAKPEPPPARPEEVLDRKKLQEAEKALAAAAEHMRQGDAPKSATKAAEARALLEEATAQAREKLDRLRAARAFKEMKDAQDGTKKETDTIAQKMRETPPLISTPEGGVPGKQDVEAAAEDMKDASQGLGQGKPRSASKAQAKSLDKLKKGREKSEDALEELQKALRDRILAYLREKFTKMLNDQRAITRETKSLDLKLRALQATSAAKGSASFEIDRKDRQLAETLAGRETSLTLIADDVIDLLSEDGTTLVFPGVVEEIKLDLVNVNGLLSRIQTGDRTQHVQGEIEAALEDILKALEQAQRTPPPPNPNQGRGSKSGAGPLLPLSSELKMVRALQQRVNERTKAFDLKRKPEAELGPEERLQLGVTQKKQGQVESMLRKLKDAAGEQ